MLPSPIARVMWLEFKWANKSLADRCQVAGQINSNKFRISNQKLTWGQKKFFKDFHLHNPIDFYFIERTLKRTKVRNFLYLLQEKHISVFFCFLCLHIVFFVSTLIYENSNIF